MECTVCLNEWSSASCIPRMLNCGHSFCEGCLKLMFKPSTQQLQCPACLATHNFKSLEDVMKLIKNFTLLSLIESAKSIQTPNPNALQKSKSTVGAHYGKLKGTLHMDLEELEECKSEEEEHIDQLEGSSSSKSQQSRKRTNEDQEFIIEPPRIQLNQKCPKHDLIIHSFLKNPRDQGSTTSLLCTKCIYERNLSQTQIEIIPQVVKDIKSSIESTRVMILHRRSQLFNALKYLQRMQRGNREVIENKLREHFSRMRKLVDTYEVRMKYKLDEMLDQQSQQLMSVQSQVEEHLDKLQNDDLNLSSLESHDDNEIIYMTKIIEDQRMHLVNFQNRMDNIDLRDISIALQLRESSYEKMEQMLGSSCNLIMDSLRQDEHGQPDENQQVGRELRMPDIMEKDKTWMCITCNNLYSIDEVFCQDCNIFRPLEMFKNLLHNPMSATDDEIQLLNERRKKEKLLILDRDQELNSQDGLWFMISSEWLYRWKCFISNRVSQKPSSIITGLSDHLQELVRRSENEKIGVLPPGPISNDDLFIKIQGNATPDGQMKLKKGLELNKHYRGVNREVWMIFHRMYGGGPILVRGALDIYSKDLTKELQKRNKESKSKNQSNNIFAKSHVSPMIKDSIGQQVQGGQQRKKRNLFVSENIGGIDEEDGIPEEHLEIQQQQRLGNFHQKMQNMNAFTAVNNAQAQVVNISGQGFGMGVGIGIVGQQQLLPLVGKKD